MELSLDTLFLESLPKVNVNQTNVTVSVALLLPGEGCQATDVADHQFNGKSCSLFIQNINLPKYTDYIVDNDHMY